MLKDSTKDKIQDIPGIDGWWVKDSREAFEQQAHILINHYRIRDSKVIEILKLLHDAVQAEYSDTLSDATR